MIKETTQEEVEHPMAIVQTRRFRTPTATYEEEEAETRRFIDSIYESTIAEEDDE